MLRYEDLVPIFPPLYPDISELSHTAAQETLEAFLQDWQKVLKDNNTRFEKALQRIQLCALLHGAMYPFPGSCRPHVDDHFSWCPYRAWYRFIHRFDTWFQLDYPHI